MKHGFIGFGNLLQAVYEGLKYDKNNSFSYISKNNNHTQISSYDSLEKLVGESDIIWFGVKPQKLEDILKNLENIDTKNKIFISPVAGKKISFIEKYLGKHTVVIRIMPNLGAAYKESVTAFCSNSDEKIVSAIKNNLEKIGKVVEISEDKFDLFTAIFGSGPAFLLKVYEIFYENIKKMNIDNDEANKLLFFLIKGTSSYFINNCSENKISNLIEKITSKGGTTQEGLNCFNNNNIGKLLEQVIIQARNKSKELS